MREKRLILAIGCVVGFESTAMDEEPRFDENQGATKRAKGLDSPRMQSHDLKTEAKLRLDKVTDVKDFETEKELIRREHYIDTLRAYRPSGLLGVYKLIVDDVMVGVQSFTGYCKGDAFIVQAVTDIFYRYQGKGYGNILRTKTAELFLSSFGKCIDWTREGGKPQMSLKPLKYLYSNNEWRWGANMASVRSALNAGYGVACISANSREGFLQMLFPRNEHMWQQNRVTLLLEVSQLLCSDEADSAHLEIEIFIRLLEDFDFQQDLDIVSFCSIVQFIYERYQDKADFISIIQSILKVVVPEKIEKIRRFAYGDAAGRSQEIALEIFYGCLPRDCQEIYLTILEMQRILRIDTAEDTSLKDLCN